MVLFAKSAHMSRSFRQQKPALARCALRLLAALAVAALLPAVGLADGPAVKTPDPAPAEKPTPPPNPAPPPNAPPPPNSTPLPKPTPPVRPAPFQKPLTAAQQARLKERNQFWKEAGQLRDAGKIDEAIAATQKTLDIDREVLGAEHHEVAASLSFLAGLLETNEDFAAARKDRDDALAIETSGFGKEHWHAIDARLALDNLALLEKLSHDECRQLDDAMQLYLKAVKLRGEAKFAEPFPWPNNLWKSAKSCSAKNIPSTRPA